jgi:hypothetical protein
LPTSASRPTIGLPIKWRRASNPQMHHRACIRPGGVFPPLNTAFMPAGVKLGGPENVIPLLDFEKPARTEP